MNDNLILLNFIETLLGTGDRKSSGNYAFHCPKCNHKKKKLEININTNERGENRWNCWICGEINEFKGKTIKSLLFKLEQTDKIPELNKIVTPNYNYTERKSPVLQLPESFTSLDSDPEDLDLHSQIKFKHALHYLKKRNITELDIIRYNIGFCYKGDHKDRIIIPSYNQHGLLNYFTARDFTGNQLKYLIPSVKRSEVIAYDYYINWDLPIILVEGVFDMLAIKRNSIPLMGKTLGDELLIKILKNNNSIYVALDSDARKNAIKICETLLSYGKKVYFVDIVDKDFSEIGFEQSVNILQNTIPLNFEALIKLKLDSI